MKTCIKCGVKKTDEEFTGVQSWCKICRKESNATYYEANRDYSLAYAKEYYDTRVKNECIVNISIDVNKAYFEAVMKKRRAEHES